MRIDHGVNMVYKRAPYVPATPGFGDDDAAFLARNGFTSVRLGLIWKAVEPQPGKYDDAYIARVRRTVNTLHKHGIATLLDFHQDLYNERYQGEGAPDWAVQDDGVPAQPQAGFPGNYFGMAALWRAFDHFWANDPGPGGVGLQDRYAAAWKHVARYFRTTDGVLGHRHLQRAVPGLAVVDLPEPGRLPGLRRPADRLLPEGHRRGAIGRQAHAGVLRAAAVLQRRRADLRGAARQPPRLLVPRLLRDVGGRGQSTPGARRPSTP